jgi:hypothetical protein
MAITMEIMQDKVLMVGASGKLTKADYAEFLPKVDALIQEKGKVSILFDMHDLHGWEAGAAWEDAKFAFHHFSDIERLAVVGEKKWHHAMTVLSKPFTRAEVRYFTREQIDQAHRWVEAGA